MVKKATAKGTTLTRREMFRLLGEASIGVGAAVALSGCVAPAAPTPAPVAGEVAKVAEKVLPPTAGPTVTVDLWQNWPGILGKAVDQLATQFNASQTGIVIKPLVTEIGNQPEKLLTAVAGGNPPDGVTLGAELVLGFSAKDMLLPLDEFIDPSSTIKRDNYADALWEPLLYQGKTYGVPALENAPNLGLGWNKTLFTAAGLDPEKPPTTLDELVTFGEKLTKFDDSKNLLQVGFDPLDAMGGGQRLNTWTRIFGANWYDQDAQKVNFTSPEMAEMVDYITSFYKMYGPEKMTAFRQSYRQWSGAPDASFPRGVEGLILEGYWAPGELKTTAQPGNTYGWGWVPTKSGERIQLIGGWNIVIPKGAKHVPEMFKFIEYVSTDDANKTILEMAGSFCATKSFASNVDFTEYGGLAWFMDSVIKADKVYAKIICPVFAEARSRLANGIDEVSYGKSTTQEMLVGVQKVVQDALDNAVKA